MVKHKTLILANDTTYTYNLRDQIIEALVANRIEVVVASKVLSFQTELTEMGCRLIDIDTGRHGTNPCSDLKLLFQYLDIINKEKPDVVLTYNIKPNVYGGIACQMTKTHYLPNITGLGTAVEYPGLMQVISTNLYRIGVASADCVFFQNLENREFFESHRILRKGCRTRLLPGSGVSLKKHKAMEYPKEGDRINFLFIARLLQEKGIDLYLNAAKRIHIIHNNVMFHICGQCDDDRYIALLKKAEEEGYIAYHGEQKDLVPYFEMAHCIVHPSYYPEGMSNVLLEAAAHCRPIITTDRPGCRETVDDRNTGFVIPIKNEDALVDTIEEFISMSWEERRVMGIEGRKKIEREFNRQLVVKAYMEEIDNIMSSEV